MDVANLRPIRLPDPIKHPRDTCWALSAIKKAGVRIVCACAITLLARSLPADEGPRLGKRRSIPVFVWRCYISSRVFPQLLTPLRDARRPCSALSSVWFLSSHSSLYALHSNYLMGYGADLNQ